MSDTSPAGYNSDESANGGGPASKAASRTRCGDEHAPATDSDPRREVPMPPENGTMTAYLQPLVIRLNAGDQQAADLLIAYSMDRLKGFATRLLSRDRMSRWYELDELLQRTAHDLVTILLDLLRPADLPEQDEVLEFEICRVV